MVHMTPEQFNEVLRRFTNLDHEVEKLANGQKRLQLDLIGKASHDDVLALRSSIDDLGEEVNSFASDVNDRLSRRIGKVAAFVGMPADQLRDEDLDDAA